MDSDKAKLILKKDGIANDFKYPVLNLSPAGEDYALEGMKPERPAEEITNLTDQNQEKLEEIDSNILSSITGGGLPDDEKLDEFLVAMDDSEEALEDYLYGYETGDKIEQPIVTETETEDKIDVSDTIGKTVDEDIDVVEDVADAVDEVPEPDQGAGNILSGLLPLVSAAGETPPPITDKKIDDLFSKEEVIKPATQEASRRREINENILKKQDKSYEEGFSKYNEIQDSNIRDIEGNKINLTAIGTFNKQINSMVKRVKKLQMYGGLSTSPQGKLKEKQNVYEQKQIVEDLLELKDRISDLPKYIYINKVVRGRETGHISKVETKRFKQSIENALKGDKYTRGLPKFLRYKDVITPSKASVSSKSLINEDYDWTKTDDDIINFIKNSRERPYYSRNQSGNNIRNQNIKSAMGR